MLILIGLFVELCVIVTNDNINISNIILCGIGLIIVIVIFIFYLVYKYIEYVDHLVRQQIIFEINMLESTDDVTNLAEKIVDSGNEKWIIAVLDNKSIPEKQIESKIMTKFPPISTIHSMLKSVYSQHWP